MNRYKIRETTFKLLFKLEFYSPEEYAGQMDIFFNGLEDESFTSEDREEIIKAIEGIQTNLSTIDQGIEQHSVGWKLERLGKVEKAILRLAIYEILFDENIPQPVAINEAVNLVKIYGDPKAKGFVNGILGSFSRKA